MVLFATHFSVILTISEPKSSYNIINLQKNTLHTLTTILHTSMLWVGLVNVLGIAAENFERRKNFGYLVYGFVAVFT